MLPILLLAFAAQLPPPGESKVEVDGARYRVLVRGSEMIVANKSLMTRRSPDERDKMRRAAKQATGCDLTDPYWEGNRLVGKASCPASPSSQAPKSEPE